MNCEFCDEEHPGGVSKAAIEAGHPYAVADIWGRRGLGGSQPFVYVYRHEAGQRRMLGDKPCPETDPLVRGTGAGGLS